MIDWYLTLSFIGGILAVLSVAPYIRDILHGSTRPNTVSWFLWVLILAIAAAAQFSAGWSFSLIFILGDLLGTSVVLILCLIGYGYKEYGRLEWACLALSIIAIILWQLTRQPLLAIVFAIIADFMAAAPTVVKAYKDPLSEYPFGWIILCVAALTGIFSNFRINLINSLFPAYLLFINGLIGSLSLIGRYRKTNDPRI